MPVGRFEGVEEALARIAGNLYVMDAARVLTAQAVDLGEKPSVISAIVKYHCTERGRVAINDAMDVHGGKGICMGPDNYLGRFYQQTPIGITVEGANILTRSLIIFGQGAVRAHPYVIKEIQAAHEQNRSKAVHDFDTAFFGHISFAMSNAVRSFLFALSSGYIVNVPTDEPTRRYYQLLTRYSASFAFAADIAMLVLGGGLKRREKLSARLGDVLSQMYLCSAVLKKFEDDGRPVEDIPLLDWAMQDGLYRIQVAFDGVLQNFPSRIAALLLRVLIFPLGQCRRPPSDELGHEVAELLSVQGGARDRLSAGCYIPTDERDAVGALEAALTSTLACEPLQAELAKARKAGKIKALDELAQIAEAKDNGLITAEQAAQLQRDYALRRKVIMVDDFSPEQLGIGK
jgi:acyl-CoA dehydrogenase